LADREFLVVVHQEHLVQNHLVALLAGQTLHPEDVSGGDPILFAAGLDNGVHFSLLLKYR
jgi:hypothetical protein